jgi:hypothetical protein
MKKIDIQKTVSLLKNDQRVHTEVEINTAEDPQFRTYESNLDRSDIDMLRPSISTPF